MRILLDECLPRRLKKLLVGHEAFTAPEMGWAGKKNGELLRLAASQFDVFLTNDQNLEYQQNLANVSIGVIILIAHDNDIAALQPLIPKAIEAMKSIEPGKPVRIAA